MFRRFSEAMDSAIDYSILNGTLTDSDSDPEDSDSDPDPDSTETQSETPEDSQSIDTTNKTLEQTKNENPSDSLSSESSDEEDQEAFDFDQKYFQVTTTDPLAKIFEETKFDPTTVPNFDQLSKTKQTFMKICRDPKSFISMDSDTTFVCSVCPDKSFPSTHDIIIHLKSKNHEKSVKSNKRSVRKRNREENQAGPNPKPLGKKGKNSKRRKTNSFPEIPKDELASSEDDIM